VEEKNTPKQEEEARHHMRRPAQIVARGRQCPVAYVPIGTLEWHGVHNPLGAETLEAAADVAVREVHHRLHHKHRYVGHGRSLQEGLWKETDG